MSRPKVYVDSPLNQCLGRVGLPRGSMSFKEAMSRKTRKSPMPAPSPKKQKTPTPKRSPPRKQKTPTPKRLPSPNKPKTPKTSTGLKLVSIETSIPEGVPHDAMELFELEPVAKLPVSEKNPLVVYRTGRKKHYALLRNLRRYFNEPVVIDSIGIETRHGATTRPVAGKIGFVDPATRQAFSDSDQSALKSAMKALPKTPRIPKKKPAEKPASPKGPMTRSKTPKNTRKRR